MPILVMCLLWVMNLIAPLDPEKLPEVFNLLGIVCVLVVLVEFLPKVFRKLVSDPKARELFGMVVTMFGFGFFLLVLNPDIDEALIQVAMIGGIFVYLLALTILKRYLVLKHGKAVKSAEDEGEAEQ